MFFLAYVIDILKFGFSTREYVLLREDLVEDEKEEEEEDGTAE